VGGTRRIRAKSDTLPGKQVETVWSENVWLAKPHSNSQHVLPERHEPAERINHNNRGYGSWRDGGFTVHDLSDPAKPKLIHTSTGCPPFPGGGHTPLLLLGRKPADVGDEGKCRKVREARFARSSLICWLKNILCQFHFADSEERNFCGFGIVGPNNLDETGRVCF
jgi:hypothetical protein